MIRKSLTQDSLFMATLALKQYLVWIALVNLILM